MKYLKRYNFYKSFFINEFNSKHKNEIIEKEKDFTISYEIELEAMSQHIDFYNMLEVFEKYFNPLLNKYDLDVDYDNSLIDRDDNDEITVPDIYNFDDYNIEDMEMSMYESTTYFSGVELKPNEYFNGIKDAFSFLDDFYFYYNKQKSFKFSDKTGLHTNIGYYSKSKWNLIKGYLLFDEDKMAYKGYELRKFNDFSGSYKKQFEENVFDYIKTIDGFSHNYIISNIDKLSTDLSNILITTVNQIGIKYVGFNVIKVKDYNYIEFRHPGGKVDKNVLKDQTLHYSNIVLACVDVQYRKKEYINKLIGFLMKFV